MGYHADFVTGQYILPGDKVVAFLLEKSSSAGYPGSAACFPSYEYKVASVPLFGRFQEYGGFKADRNSAGAHYTLACHRICPERQREAKEGGIPLPRTLGQLVKASPPLAFMLPETFQMMVSLAINQKAYEPLPVALEANRKLHALLATPKGQAFLQLRAELKDVEEAYLSASIRQAKAKSTELLMRLDTAKKAFGVSEYVNFNDVADAALRLSGSMMQTDPFTGERFELPAPLFMFSDYSGQCASEVIGFAYEGTGGEKEPVLEGLLQVLLVDFALMLLGRLWQPSLYMGDERYNDTIAVLGAQLCAAALPVVQSEAQGLSGYLATKRGIVSEYADGELKRLRALLPKLKEVAAGLQETIETLEKLG
jgi:hypothetical protein